MYEWAIWHKGIVIDYVRGDTYMQACANTIVIYGDEVTVDEEHE